MSRSHSVVAWTAALWLLAGCAASAEEKPLLRTGEAALAKPTQMEFIESPLSDVVDFLEDHHGIEIQMDIRALEDVGIGADTPITKSLKGLSLRSALNLVLRDLSLTWIIRDEVLLITTPKEAESNLTTKVYDVYDLVVCYDEDDEPWDDYDTLINQITTNIRPMTWDDVGGPASITGASLGTAKVLIVSQTRDVHPEIAALFEDIREIAQQNPDAELPQRNKPVIRPEPSIGSFDDPIDPAGKDK